MQITSVKPFAKQQSFVYFGKAQGAQNTDQTPCDSNTKKIRELEEENATLKRQIEIRNIRDDIASLNNQLQSAQKEESAARNIARNCHSYAGVNSWCDQADNIRKYQVNPLKSRLDSVQRELEALISED